MPGYKRILTEEEYYARLHERERREQERSDELWGYFNSEVECGNITKEDAEELYAFEMFGYSLNN